MSNSQCGFVTKGVQMGLWRKETITANSSGLDPEKPDCLYSRGQGLSKNCEQRPHEDSRLRSWDSKAQGLPCSWRSELGRHSQVCSGQGHWLDFLRGGRGVRASQDHSVCWAGKELVRPGERRKTGLRSC